jgi:sugar lactone lactonase YvrE
MEGVVFGESPRWYDGRLWFSDWGAQQVVAVDESGSSEVVVKVDFPSFPMCIDFTPQGELIVVSSRSQQLLRRGGDGELSPFAQLDEISRKPWNDIVIDGRGNTYVNGTGFDFPGGEFAPGLLALVTPDGAARQVADGLAFPNGMAVTADNGTLIVGESYANQLTAFDIAQDGTLTNRHVWAATGDDHPDGICIDAAGAVWYADVGNKRCRRVAEGGEVLDTVALDRGCFACVLGGADRSTLFIVAQRWGEQEPGSSPSGQVLSVAAPAQRAGWP